MTPPPEPSRASPMTNRPIWQALDLPAPPNAVETLSGPLGTVHEIAGRLLRLRSWQGGDLGEALRTAAADLTGIADTLTTPAPETRWPLGGLDGG